MFALRYMFKSSGEAFLNSNVSIIKTNDLKRMQRKSDTILSEKLCNFIKKSNMPNPGYAKFEEFCIMLISAQHRVAHEKVLI